MNLDLIKDRINYNPETGVFTWKKASRGTYAGTVAGAVNSHGYITVKIAGKAIKGHHLAWWIFYGTEAAGMLDHINGNRSDNRIANLRLATASQNRMNSAKRKDNTSGAKGVYWSNRKGRWIAMVRACGVRKARSFKDFESAKACYEVLSRELHGDFSRTG